MSYDPNAQLHIVDIQSAGRAFVARFLRRENPEITRVEVPAEYNGCPVESISRFAFADCKYLQEVYIPDSVTQIGTWAFHNCPELREIRLPKNVKIEAQAFAYCPKLAPRGFRAGGEV